MSLFPSRLFETVVAIGTEALPGKFTADSTGFLILTNDGTKSETALDVFLITNRHVFDNRNEAIFRFGSNSFKFPLKDSEGSLWTSHKNRNIDVAAAMMPYRNWGLADTPCFVEDIIASTDKMKKKNIGIGSDIYILGFPMGIAGKERNYPIVRSGIIARLDEETIENGYYYIDAAIYGGNSGGPVFSKEGGVIGVVSSVVPQWQALYGYRNGRYEERMTLYEHTNLGKVVPMEYVMETIDFLKRKITKRGT